MTQNFESNNKLIIPKVLKNNFCSYHLYPLRFKWEKIRIFMKEFYRILKKNIEYHFKYTTNQLTNLIFIKNYKKC